MSIDKEEYFRVYEPNTSEVLYPHVALECPHGGSIIPNQIVYELFGNGNISFSDLERFIENDRDVGTARFYSHIAKEVRFSVFNDVARVFVDGNRSSDDWGKDGFMKEVNSMGEEIYRRKIFDQTRRYIQEKIQIPYLSLLDKKISQHSPDFLVLGHTMNGFKTFSSTDTGNETERPLVLFSNGNNHINGISQSVLLSLKEIALQELKNIDCDEIVTHYNNYLQQRFPDEQRECILPEDKVFLNSPYTGKTSLEKFTNLGDTQAVLIEINKAMVMTKEGITVTTSIIEKVTEFLNAIGQEKKVRTLY